MRNEEKKTVDRPFLEADAVHTACVSVRSRVPGRHVVLPQDIAKALPKNGRLLSEIEWRALGVQQSRGWIHYAIHKPEPHIMLFRRPLNYQQQQQAAQRASVAAR